MQHTSLTPTPPFVGKIEVYDTSGIKGWIADKSNQNRVFSLEIHIDGKAIGKAAIKSSPDSEIKFENSAGPYRFSFKFPEAAYDGAEHEISIFIPEVNAYFSSPRKIFFPKKTNKNPLGNLDTVTDNLMVTGWAWPNGAGPARVDILINNKVVASGHAGSPRPDLIAAGLPHGDAGFQLKIPKEEISTPTISVDARVNNVPLHGGPIKVDLLKRIKMYKPTLTGSALHVEVDNWYGNDLKAVVMTNGVDSAVINLRACSGPEKGKENKASAQWHLPKAFHDGRPRIFSIKIISEHSEICSEPAVLRYPVYRSHIDGVEAGRISGWAVREGNAEPLEIGVFQNGELLAKQFADQERQDVQQAFRLPTKTVGFDLKVPSLQHAHIQQLSLIDLDTNVQICSIAISHRLNALTRIAEVLGSSLDSKDNVALSTVLAPLVQSTQDTLSYAVEEGPSQGLPDDSSIDIIIPIYGGATETMECIESVISAKNDTPHRIILIDDASPDPLIKAYLQKVQNKKISNVLAFEKKENGGFSETVNLGIVAADRRDVLILNADTVVQDHWLDRIVAVAKKDPRIGTVTPLSNNGEIVSAPYICQSRAIHTREIAQKLDQIASTENPNLSIEIPVAIGFCMYVRRKCIDEVGLLDAKTWGRGYGEEVDFCIKASSKGWKHVAAADTYVVHRGNVSFGNEKLQRIIESAKKISQRYPFYDSSIQRFLSADPIRHARSSLNISVLAQHLPTKRLLHVTHNFGGGTAKYVRDLKSLAKKEGYANITLEFDAKGSSKLYIETENSGLDRLFDELHSETYHHDETDLLIRHIQNLEVDTAHVHAIFGVSPKLLDFLTSSMAYNITIHDYTWICPRVTLSQGAGEYCGEPNEDKCNGCLSIYGAHAGLKHFLSDEQPDIHSYRRYMKKIVLEADIVMAGAQDVVKRLESHQVQGNFRVQPHPLTETEKLNAGELRLTRPKNGTLKVALLGGISDIKGFHTLLACAQRAQEKNLPISFIVIGHTADDRRALRLPNIAITGPYNEAEIFQLISRYQPDIFFMPNRWPETYSYTLSQAFLAGVWPVVSAIGAPEERVNAVKFGTAYPFNSTTDEILDLLMSAGWESRKTTSRPKLTYTNSFSQYLGTIREKAVSQDLTINIL